MKFTIDGAAAVNSRKPKAAAECDATIAKLPDGKLVTTKALLTLTGYTFGTLRQMTAFISDELRVNTGNRLLYGNKKTIQAYREQFEV